MLPSHVSQQVRLLLELPVALEALKPGLHAALVLHVVLEALARLVETAAADAFVVAEEGGGERWRGGGGGGGGEGREGGRGRVQAGEGWGEVGGVGSWGDWSEGGTQVRV